MTTNLLSTESRRELLSDQCRDLQERGVRVSIINRGSCYTDSGVLSVIARAHPGEFDDLQHQLNTLEDAAEAARRRDSDEDARAEERRRGATWTREDEEERQRLFREASARAAAADSVEGRLGRVEAVLERIAGLLEKR